MRFKKRLSILFILVLVFSTMLNVDINLSGNYSIHFGGGIYAQKIYKWAKYYAVYNTGNYLWYSGYSKGTSRTSGYYQGFTINPPGSVRFTLTNYDPYATEGYIYDPLYSDGSGIVFERSGSSYHYLTNYASHPTVPQKSDFTGEYVTSTYEQAYPYNYSSSATFTGDGYWYVFVGSDNLPTLSVNSPLQNLMYPSVSDVSSIPITGTICDADKGDIETISYRIDGTSNQAGTQLGSTIVANGSNQAFTATIDVSKVMEGSHTLYISVQDNNGGKNETAIPFKIDQTSPSVTAPSINADGSSQITVIPNAADPTSYGVSSGVSSCLFNRNGVDMGTWQSGNCVDTGLLPNTKYTYKYKARDNAMNTSEYSGSTSIYTLAQVPSLSCIGISSTSINLGTTDSNPEATQYQVYTIDSNGNPGLYVTSSGTLSEKPQWITLTNKGISINGLNTGITYTFKAKAINGGGINTSESSPLSITTKVEAPDDITYTYTAPSDLKISWSPVAGASSYSISTDGGNTWVYSTPDTYYIPTGIEPGQKYSYWISAVNGKGYSDRGTIEVITPLSIPTVIATTTGTSITLSWDSIINAAGYDVTLGDISQSTTGTSIMINGLETNTQYTYCVRAKNDVTTGPWSQEQIISTQGIIPGVPGNLKAIPGNNSIKIIWDPVEDATTYQVKADDQIIDNITGTSYIDSGLEPGTQHTYMVRVFNSGGENGWSSPITVTTIPLESSVPSNINAITTGDSITLTWDSVPDSSSYDVEMDNPDQSITDPVYIRSVTENTFTKTGIESGSTHTFRVRSVINGVPGSWSQAVTILAGGNLLDAPQNVTASSITSTSAVLSWDSVTGAITYDIERNGEVTANIEHPVAFNVIDLDPNTRYTYRVRAVNSYGPGEWSTPVTKYTLANKPVSGERKLLQNNDIQITWEANGNPDGTLYLVVACDESNSLIKENTWTTSLTDTLTALDPSVTYKIKVKAKNHENVETDWCETTKINGIKYTYTENCSIGKDLNLILKGNNIDDFSMHTFTLSYNKDDMELVDACTITRQKELNTGIISGTDINITEYSPGTIKFTINKTIASGKSWSGPINIIKFKCKINGASTITCLIN